MCGSAMSRYELKSPTHLAFITYCETMKPNRTTDDGWIRISIARPSCPTSASGCITWPLALIKRIVRGMENPTSVIPNIILIETVIASTILLGARIFINHTQIPCLLDTLCWWNFTRKVLRWHSQKHSPPRSSVWASVNIVHMRNNGLLWELLLFLLEYLLYFRRN